MKPKTKHQKKIVELGSRLPKLTEIQEKWAKTKVLSIIKRNGFKGNCHNVPPFILFKSILTSNRAETLLKVGYGELIPDVRKIEYWDSLMICVRHKYKMNLKDYDIWSDYLDLLVYFEKDIHNPKYICPKDLHFEHDRLVRKKEIFQEDRSRKLNRERAIENEEQFKELNSKFFGIEFEDKDIKVKVLDSISEVIEEGDVMHHCVFTNNYHLKENSLILTSRLKKNDKRLETIEVSLNPLKVVQCRGACNSNTDYHDKIIDLINKNLRIIKKRSKLSNT